MAKIKGLVDDHGTIYACNKKVPEEYRIKLLEVLAELEDNECHKLHSFPKSQLHKVTGADKVYRAYIDKISGWRLHVQYGEDKKIHLCEVLEPADHDRGTEKKLIKQKKKKYS
jgi:hypothetical protein